MGTNNKSSSAVSERVYANGSPSNKKHSSGTQPSSQRPSPTKSINIKTPHKNQSSNSQGKGRSGSCSPPMLSFFAASKCFDSPSPQSLPKPPTSWFNESGAKNEGCRRSGRSQRARKSLNLSNDKSHASCATEFANASFTSINNDHYTQNLKLLLNVSA